MNTTTTSLIRESPTPVKQNKCDERIQTAEQYQNVEQNGQINGQSNGQMTVVNDYLEKPAGWTPQPTIYGNDENDLTSFFKNMEHTARKFNARLQLKVKRMISDIIYDAEEQWINTSTEQI